MFNIIFANDWIQTADLWYLEQPLYHNPITREQGTHFQTILNVYP